MAIVWKSVSRFLLAIPLKSKETEDSFDPLILVAYFEFSEINLD